MPALNHFGLDIGTHSIKAVQLSGSFERPNFVSAGQIPSPGKGLVSESPVDQAASADAIKRLHHESSLELLRCLTSKKAK